MALAQNCFTLVKTKSDDAWNVRMFICPRCTIIYNSPLEGNVFFWQHRYNKIGSCLLGLPAWKHAMRQVFPKKRWLIRLIAHRPYVAKTVPKWWFFNVVYGNGFTTRFGDFKHFLLPSIYAMMIPLTSFFRFRRLGTTKDFEIGLNLPNGYFIGKIWGKRKHIRHHHMKSWSTLFSNKPMFLGSWPISTWAATNSGRSWLKMGNHGPLGKTSETTGIWTAKETNCVVWWFMVI